LFTTLTDRLSKELDLKVEVENNNKNQKLIKKEWIREIIKVVIKGLKIILIEKIKRIRRRDKKVVKVVEEIKKAGVKILIFLFYFLLIYFFIS